MKVGALLRKARIFIFAIESACPFFLQLINLGFHVEQLNSLQAAINQPWDAVEKTQAEHVFVEEEEEWRSGDKKKPPLQPAPPLRLCAEKSWRQLSAVVLRTEPNPRFPVGILIVFLDVARERLDIVMNDGMS